MDEMEEVRMMFISMTLPISITNSLPPLALPQEPDESSGCESSDWDDTDDENDVNQATAEVPFIAEFIANRFRMLNF